MSNYWIYLLIMAVSTYLIRAVPFALIRQKINNTFIKSFLYYIPYTVLSAMTFPAALYATGNVYAAATGLFVAVLLAFFRQSLTVVAISSCVVVFISECFIFNIII